MGESHLRWSTPFSGGMAKQIGALSKLYLKCWGEQSHGNVIVRFVIVEKGVA